MEGETMKYMTIFVMLSIMIMKNLLMKYCTYFVSAKN